MGEVGRDQAAINAQLQAANEEIRASLRVITEQLTHIQQRDRPNGPQPPARRQPYQSDQDSDADSTDDTQNREAEHPNRAGDGRGREQRVQGGDDPGQRRGRDREEEEPWIGGKDPKLKAPTFAGKVDPDAYITWENRMEYIFDYYRYSKARKIALAAAQLTDNALAW